MKILFSVEHFWPEFGGIEVASIRRAEEMIARGHEVSVIVGAQPEGSPDVDRYHGISIHRLPLSTAFESRDPALLLELKAAYSRLRAELAPDVVQAPVSGPTIFFPYSARRSDPTPLVVSLHGSWSRLGLARDNVLVHAVAEADWAVGCSQSVLTEILELDVRAPARSSAILNGLDPPGLEPAPLTVDPPVLCCVGRLVHEKGYDVAIAALAEVVEQFPGTRLTIAGDGPERRALERLVRTLGLEHAVEFTGWASPNQVSSIINSSAIVLVPSRAEGFGLVALEAMLMGRPVVASDVGGLPEVVGDGHGGVLVPSDDPRAMASAIVALLMDPVLDSKGARGRAYALREHSLSRSVDAYLDLFTTLVEEGGDRG